MNNKLTYQNIKRVLTSKSGTESVYIPIKKFTIRFARFRDSFIIDLMDDNIPATFEHYETIINISSTIYDNCNKLYPGSISKYFGNVIISRDRDNTIRVQNKLFVLTLLNNSSNSLFWFISSLNDIVQVKKIIEQEYQREIKIRPFSTTSLLS